MPNIEKLVPVSRRHIANAAERFGKAASLVSLVQTELERMHLHEQTFTTPYQLITLLELVDSMLLDQEESMERVLKTAQ